MKEKRKLIFFWIFSILAVVGAFLLYKFRPSTKVVNIIILFASGLLFSFVSMVITMGLTNLLICSEISSIKTAPKKIKNYFITLIVFSAIFIVAMVVTIAFDLILISSMIFVGLFLIMGINLLVLMIKTKRKKEDSNIKVVSVGEEIKEKDE